MSARLTALLALWAVLAALPPVARGDNEGQPSAAVAPAPPEAPQAAGIPLLAGDVAPVDGVLLPEPLMVYYLGLDLRLKETELKVEARDRALDQLAEDLAQAKTPQPRTWWERNQFYAGAATTLLLVIGGAQAIDKFR